MFLVARNANSNKRRKLDHGGDDDDTKVDVIKLQLPPPRGGSNTWVPTILHVPAPICVPSMPPADSGSGWQLFALPRKPVTYNMTARQERLWAIADAAGDTKGSSPFLDFMIDEQTAFENTLLASWLDPEDFRGLGRVCHTLREVFGPNNHATWDIMVQKMKAEREAVVKESDRKNDPLWVCLTEAPKDMTPWERIWFGKVHVSSREEDYNHSSILLQEFATQFGGADDDDNYDPKNPPVNPFRRLWLLPLTTMLTGWYTPNPLDVRFSRDFTEYFTNLVERHVRDFFERAKECAYYRQGPGYVKHVCKEVGLQKEHIEFLKKISGENLQQTNDYDFPLPYNHRIVRRLLNDCVGMIIPASNEVLEEVWRLLIDVSFSLLKAMLGNVRSGKWCPTREDLVAAAKTLRISKKAVGWADPQYGSEDEPLDLSQHHRGAFKRRWQSCTRDEKMGIAIFSPLGRHAGESDSETEDSDGER
ncbi:MAG: hypothetical protein SGILL_009584 [Bacillariaceae sp.]